VTSTLAEKFISRLFVQLVADDTRRYTSLDAETGRDRIGSWSVIQQEAKLSLGQPTVLPHSRLSIVVK